MLIYELLTPWGSVKRELPTPKADSSEFLALWLLSISKVWPCQSLLESKPCLEAPRPTGLVGGYCREEGFFREAQRYHQLVDRPLPLDGTGLESQLRGSILYVCELLRARFLFRGGGSCKTAPVQGTSA